jgi:sortase (surface protein transpeptidase)
VSWPPPPSDPGWDNSPPAGDVGSTAPASRWGRPGRWWLIALALLLVAAPLFALGLDGGQRSLPGPVDTAGKPAPAATGKAGHAPAALAVARSVPLELSIPAIGLTVSLSELGLNSNDTVEVPTNFQQPGWYEYGPSPGQLGSSVILGHVDSYLGPAVFFQLRTLRPGDTVDVTLADGVITHFVVRQVAMYLKADFPTQLVYGSHGSSALQLVTCGGVFDSQTGHYLSNVVVYTSLVSAS